MINCPRCGRENPEANQFCGRCGLEIANYNPRNTNDADDIRYCTKHKKEPTRLACGRCERPFCHQCLVIGPAGPRCAECARQHIPIKPAAVLHDAKRGLSGIFRGGPFMIYIWFIIASMLFGLVRGCMYMNDPGPSEPPVESVTTPRE